MFGTRSRRTLAALAAATLFALTGCSLEVDGAALTDNTSRTEQSKPAKQKPTNPTKSAKPGKPSTTSTPAGTDTALAALATLPVKGRAPMTGYDRDCGSGHACVFGPEWDDSAGDFATTRNGCDTRNDILARDLQREVVESNGCVVTSGVLAYEPYLGVENYYFDKQDDEYSTDLDTEHIVALGSIWVTGGQQLSEEERAAIANDPINLMLADPSENRSKGDADFATWLPPNKSFHCSYAARQIRVKVKYGLWVTAPEKAAMERVLATCPNEPLDQPDPQAGYTADAVSTPPAATPEPSPSTTSTPDQNNSSVTYANCDEVRAAGNAPLYEGDPGYNLQLDGDADGDACE